jgi:hypothetical protein
MKISNFVQKNYPQAEETLFGDAKKVILWTGLTARF